MYFLFFFEKQISTFFFCFQILTGNFLEIWMYIAPKSVDIVSFDKEFFEDEKKKEEPETARMFANTKTGSTKWKKMLKENEGTVAADRLFSV